MLGQQAKIQEHINKLIFSLRPNASVALQTNIKSYSKKVLNSYVSGSMNESAVKIKDKIIDKVSKTTDNKGTLQCQQTINRLMSVARVQKKPQILKMLLKTSDLLHKGKNLSNIFKQPKSQAPLNLTQQTLSQTTFIRARKPLSHQVIQKIRNRGSLQSQISQSDILKQITFALQNIQSNFIHQSKQSQPYQIQFNIGINQSVRRIVSQLCDIGWLYRKITKGLGGKGTVEKALALAVQEELNQYYRWLAVIENMIKAQQLTLRKFILWSYQPMEKLKWLAIIIEAVRPYHGCQIISIINSYRPQGSHIINELLNRVLAHLIQPLLQFVHNWMYKGQLIDDYKEYFVEENTKVNQYLQWFQRFSLLQKNIPNILDKQSALMIFKAGKTIYFLKNNCKQNHSVSIPFISPNQILTKDICQSSTILSLQFKKWLRNVYQQLSRTLVQILNSHFNMQHHLNSFKYFFLMGKGDFIQQLVDSLKQQLQKPKHHVYEHTLDGYINDAVVKSFVDFKLIGQNHSMIAEKMFMGKIKHENSYKTNIVDRLLAKKIDFGQTAWDSFNFQYSMEKIEPLFSVITPEFINNYQKIFHFLWKLKRVELLLKQIWMIHQKEYTRKIKSTRGPISKLLQRCNLLRTTMSHFLNNLYGYVMIAIQSCWTKFALSVQKSSSLDQIISEHLILQKQLLSVTFNIPSKKLLSQSLTNIFKSMDQFKNLQLKILTQIGDYTERIRSEDNRRKIRDIGIMTEEAMEEINGFDNQGLNKRLDQVQDIYQRTFNTFFDHLRKEQDDATVLIYRLDFSEYYANKELQEQDKSNLLFMNK